MTKKGIVFNWIFSLIAGVIIFSFLVYFAVQNTDLFGSVTAEVVAQEFEVLLSGYETIKTTSEMDFGKKIRLEFKCDDGNQRLEINNKGKSNLWGKVVFAPEEIENEKIFVSTESWNVPFRVGNVIFVWDKKYDLTGDVPDVDLLEKLNGRGEEIKFEQKVYPLDNRFICSGTGKIVYYKESPELKDYAGWVCFGNKGALFFGKAMMVGAVLSDSLKEYECVSEALEKRMKVMKAVYDKKRNTLVLEGKCSRGYNKVKSAMIKYTPFNFDSMNMEAFVGIVEAMQKSNSELIREGCAGVY